MPLKTFLATVETRIVVDVPDDYGSAEFNESLDITEKGKVTFKGGKVVDVQVLDVSSDEGGDGDKDW